MKRIARPALLLSLWLLGGCGGSPLGPAMDRAQASFNAGQWEQAAIQMADISRSPNESEEAREVAGYRLAVSLKKAGLPAAAASMLKEVASSPGHPSRNDAMKELLLLSVDLPEAANVVGPLLQFEESGRQEVMKGLPAPVLSKLNFLIGRFEYENADCEKAKERLAKVNDRDRARALMLTALCHVKDHKSVPAAKALEEALQAAAKLPEAEAKRLTDLANMQMAQLFYSAALAPKAEKRMVTVDRAKANDALKYWKKVEASSPFATEAQWQRAWVELALGDPKSALADAHAAATTAGFYGPEAEELEATIKWGMDEKDAKKDGIEALRAFIKKYSAAADALKVVTEGLAKDKEHSPDDAAFALLVLSKVHPQQIEEAARLAVLHAFSTERLKGDLDYNKFLDDEREKLEQMSDLRPTKAGERAVAAIDGERKALVKASAERVRAALKTAAEELEVYLKEAKEAVAAGG